MAGYEAIVDENGRITLPAELTSELRVTPGDRVEVFVADDGQVYLHAVNRSWADIGAPTGAERSLRLSIRQMDDAIADHLADDDARIRRNPAPPPRAGRSAAE